MVSPSPSSPEGSNANPANWLDNGYFSGRRALAFAKWVQIVAIIRPCARTKS
jgi:hypothetical protein